MGLTYSKRYSTIVLNETRCDLRAAFFHHSRVLTSLTMLFAPWQSLCPWNRKQDAVHSRIGPFTPEIATRYWRIGFEKDCLPLAGWCVSTFKDWT